MLYMSRGLEYTKESKLHPNDTFLDVQFSFACVGGNKEISLSVGVMPGNHWWSEHMMSEVVFIEHLLKIVSVC